MSHLDRIYASATRTHSLSRWEHEHTTIPSDHKMVSVLFAPLQAPHIGKGRWTWPLGLLNDDKLTLKIAELRINLQREIPSLPGDRSMGNIQRLWEDFKQNICREAKASAKVQLAKIQNRITAIKDKITQENNSARIDVQDESRTHVISLERELEHLEKKRYKNAYARAQAQWHEKGERINKYWCKLNSPKTPRDLIYKLIDPDTDTPTTRTSEMAEIARHHHDRLQTDGLAPITSPPRQHAQATVLNTIPPEQKLNDPASPLHLPITREQTHSALLTCKDGTAAGMDGIPYEVWKHLHESYLSAQKKNKNPPSFDIIGCLMNIFNDIQLHGVDPTTNFSLGWMCPIYKKKDCSRIENYCPITLLNTDYKTMTKALAMQLATHIWSLIHPDQTGFIPKHSIFDPIRLAKTMCDYVDYMEEDGAIIALDQDRAYDKIDHNYLLTTLKTFNLPDCFISTVTNLYEHAYATVAMNGILSNTYRVTRGVQQGDPLSCLLFDLAIEPLACLLRTSPNLQGFTIPGTPTKTLINMYADDTTIYLFADDKYEDLESALLMWCLASGAKFNLEKTEVIPIGTKAHRDHIIATRRLHPLDQPLRDEIKVALDGHAVRCLGA
jgi:hypothetical protein